MRILTGFVLSMTVLLLPSFAVSDPVQNGQQPTTASTEPPATQAPASAQAMAAPSQSATSAAAQATPETVVVRGDRVDLDQVVCKEEPASTGSRIGGGRECHTQREWNRRMRESQEITRHQEIVGFHQ